MSITTARRIVVIGCVIAALCLCFAVLTMCKRSENAKDRAQTANATGKALDTVAQETPAIRAEQQEKQRAVDEIQGADTRLPDGFGADLERVRRNGERRNP